MLSYYNCKTDSLTTPHKCHCFQFKLLNKDVFIMHAKLFQSYLAVRTYGLQPARLFSPWDSPAKNTEVACPALLQEIFLTQGLNPHLSVPCIGRWILYYQGHLGSPVFSMLFTTVNYLIFLFNVCCIALHPIPLSLIYHIPLVFFF